MHHDLLTHFTIIIRHKCKKNTDDKPYILIVHIGLESAFWARFISKRLKPAVYCMKSFQLFLAKYDLIDHWKQLEEVNGAMNFRQIIRQEYLMLIKILPSSTERILNDFFSLTKQVRMYYRSWTGGRCCIGAGQTLHVHSLGGSTFLREMTSWPPSWKCDIKWKIQLNQSMHIYVKNISTKFHPDLIKNDAALGFFWRGLPQQEQEHKDE